MKLLYVAAAFVLACFALSALAQTSSMPRIDKRQANQEGRIEAGEKSGQLTPKEADRLEKGQARVQKMEAKAAADGKVTKKERGRIEQAQDRQSRKIYRERHDKQATK